MTSIGDNAFIDCYGLTRVEINDLAAWFNIDFGNSIANPLSYAHHLYLNGNEITKLVIPDGVTYIGSDAFSSCSGLTSVEIPNSVTSIGEMAFYDCNSMTSIKIPNSVTSIGVGAFFSCSSLTSVEIPNSVTSIANFTFQGCKSLTSIEIPNSVTSIGDFAFYDCNSLKNIEIGESVSSIGDHNFEKCPIETAVLKLKNIPAILKDQESLKNLTIGSAVKQISDYAFDGCTEIEKVTCLGKIPPVAVENIFAAVVYRFASLYVPEDCINSYKTTEPWSNFFEILDESGVSVIMDNPESVVTVYSVNGTVVKKACSPEDLKLLEPGIYIIAGKKVIVK